VKRSSIPLASSPPLLNPDNKLMVVWSPKSACTTVFTWFINVIGRLDELSRYSSPHRYRIEVYQKSELRLRGLKHPIKHYRMVRVIRDPYTRTASIYRHALRTKLLENYPRTVPAGLDPAAGFSFLRFLDCVGMLNLSEANPHLQAQFSPVEMVHEPEIIINISKQDLFTELNKVEESFELPRTNFKELTWLHELEVRRKMKPRSFDGQSADEFPFDRKAASGLKPWPSYEQLLTPRARVRIERLYVSDFDAYADYL
jgi:Sulfotransferase family